MRGCVLSAEQLIGLAALPTTPGPWCVSTMRGTVRAISPDDPLPPAVVAQCPPSGWLAKGDPDLLAAALDLLTTALDLQARLASYEEAARCREQAGRPVDEAARVCSAGVEISGQGGRR